MTITPTWHPTAATPITLVSDFATLASSVDEGNSEIVSVRQQRSYLWADAVGRTTQVGMSEFDLGVQVDTGVEYRYLGGVWKPQTSSKWIAYTPTITNATVSGTPKAEYRFIGGQVFAKLQFTVTAMSTNPTFNLPVAAVAPLAAFDTFNGIGTIRIGANTYQLFAVHNNTSTTSSILYAAASPGFANISASYPTTFTSGSTLAITFSYEPA